MRRHSLFLVVALVALLAGLAFLQQAQGGLSAKGAESFALQDAALYLQKNYAGKETQMRAVETRPLDGGRFAVGIEIAANPHSPCPTVERLDYELMPVAQPRPPQMLVKDCETHPILRREQAIINSAKFEGISQLVAADGRACAFAVPLLETAAEKEYCPFAGFAALKQFELNAALPTGSWLLQWEAGSEKVLLALDPAGREVARKKA
ncbi:MAG: hypothetical protein WC792_05630 [Candidatus Micrarchaeia archaeon]|jgi:hypothetical protein